MRNKAYRYHQNRTHNNRPASHHLRRGGRFFKTNYKKSWLPYSKNIEWNTHDTKQMENLKQQIDEQNGESYHGLDGKKLPKYRTYE